MSEREDAGLGGLLLAGGLSGPFLVIEAFLRTQSPVWEFAWNSQLGSTRGHKVATSFNRRNGRPGLAYQRETCLGEFGRVTSREGANSSRRPGDPASPTACRWRKTIPRAPRRV